MGKQEFKVVLPEFGKYLKHLRKSRKLKQTQVVYRSKSIENGIKFTTSSISRYESGKFTDPSLLLLQTFSIVYDEPIENFVKVIMEEKYAVNIEPRLSGNHDSSLSASNYVLILEEMGGMIKLLNGKGLFVLKSLLKGLIMQREFLKSAKGKSEIDVRSKI